MAKIKLGAIVVAMSGKLGGHVFARNRGGAYMRTKVTPTNPNTSVQSAVRSAFASISSAWSSLTTSQRKSWNTAVNLFKKTDVFGDIKVPSGKALFQRLNSNLNSKSIARIDVAPQPKEVLTAEITGVDIDDFDQYEATFDGTPASGSTLVYSSGPVSAGTTYVKNLMRLLPENLNVVAGTLSVFASYSARFPAPVVGQKIFTGIRFMNANGETSPMQIIESVVVSS